MASRVTEKEHARERRRERERAEAARTLRRRRLTILAGVGAIAIAIIAVLITVSVDGSGPTPDASLAGAPRGARARSAAGFVGRLLSGIPQHGDTLGNPHAPVTVTEYGDLECSVCDAFALDGGEDQLISSQVRAGKVKFVYRSLETATSEQGADAPQVFRDQQAAADAAGAQHRAWDYILLFFREQGQEGTPYVTSAYLTGLARQIPGLDVRRWDEDRFRPAYATQLRDDAERFDRLGVAVQTPTLVATGPRGRTRPVQQAAPYSVVARMIASVS